jgi:hypothetical protein
MTNLSVSLAAQHLGSGDCVHELTVGRTVLDFMQHEPFCRYFKSSGMSEGMSANVGTSEFFA